MDGLKQISPIATAIGTPEPARSQTEIDTTLLVTLGPGLQSLPHGDLLVLDWQRKRPIDQLRANNRTHETSHKGFAGAFVHGDRLLVAMEAELWEFSLDPLRIEQVHTLPFFNDVHHVCHDGRRIWVANTGLDCVEELDSQGVWRQTHDLIGDFGRRPRHVAQLLASDLVKSWRRMRGRYQQYGHLPCRPAFRNLTKLYSRQAIRHHHEDLRFADLRPHALHPNHVLPVGDDLWVTLWRTGEVVSLRERRILASGLGHPHDGIVAGSEYYVTDCLNNRLIVYSFDAASQTLGPRIREQILTREKREGFLRGVAVCGDRVFVGFTARRGAPKAFQQARILMLDRATLEIRDRWDVPHELGTGLFSILPVGRHYT